MVHSKCSINLLLKKISSYNNNFNFSVYQLWDVREAPFHAPRFNVQVASWASSKYLINAVILAAFSSLLSSSLPLCATPTAWSHKTQPSLDSYLLFPTWPVPSHQVAGLVEGELVSPLSGSDAPNLPVQNWDLSGLGLARLRCHGNSDNPQPQVP